MILNIFNLMEGFLGFSKKLFYFQKKRMLDQGASNFLHLSKAKKNHQFWCANILPILNEIPLIMWNNRQGQQTKYTLKSLYLLNVNNIYKIEHLRWRYVHIINILGLPMLQSLAMW
jgi:hypothetical protein